MDRINHNCGDDDDVQLHKNTKEIYVTSFTEKSAQQFREQVQEVVGEYGPDRPIVVYIDSYGGFVDSLASMLETMDEVPNPFITVAIGKSMSCGAILLSHGDYRFCGRYARVMVHEVQSGAWGNVRSMKNDVNEVLRLNCRMMELLAKNCGMKSYEELKERFKQKDADELWMSPEDALKFGIVDYVGMPKLIPVSTYQCGVLPEKPSRRNSPEKSSKTSKKKPNKSAAGKKKKDK